MDKHYNNLWAAAVAVVASPEYSLKAEFNNTLDVLKHKRAGAARDLKAGIISQAEYNKIDSAVRGGEILLKELL